ncbi:unnamed protein product, partial [Prorocentrum cordatum]
VKASSTRRPGPLCRDVPGLRVVAPGAGGLAAAGGVRHAAVPPGGVAEEEEEDAGPLPIGAAQVPGGTAFDQLAARLVDQHAADVACLREENGSLRAQVAQLQGGRLRDAAAADVPLRPVPARSGGLLSPRLCPGVPRRLPARAAEDADLEVCQDVGGEVDGQQQSLNRRVRIPAAELAPFLQMFDVDVWNAGLATISPEHLFHVLKSRGLKDLSMRRVSWVMQHLGGSKGHPEERDAEVRFKTFMSWMFSKEIGKAWSREVAEEVERWQYTLKAQPVSEVIANLPQESSPEGVDSKRNLVPEESPVSAQQRRPKMDSKVSATDVASAFFIPNRRRALGGIIGRSRAQTSVFVDASALEESAKQLAWDGDYDVAKLYHDKGTAQWLAQHPLFSTAQFLALLLNTIWIGIETDHNDKDILYEADLGIVLVENMFCLFFFWEWSVRLCAFRRKSECLYDRWFAFDTALLLLMMFETWALLFVSAVLNSEAANFPTDLLRLCRLARFMRAARIARLLRCIPELAVITRGLLVVARTVFFICLLLTLLVYVFAILFVQFTRDTSINSDGHFDHVASAMLTLVLRGLIPDMAPMTYNFAEESALTQVKRLIFDSGFDFTEDDTLTTQDIAIVLTQDNIVDGFRQLGIDTDDLFEHSKLVFRDRKEIRLRDFWQLIALHRGNSPVKVRDLVSMRQFLHSEISALASQ